jgi:hypothetical protein
MGKKGLEHVFIRCLPRTLFRIKYGTVPMVDTQMVTEGVIAEEVLLTDRTLISSVILIGR